MHPTETADVFIQRIKKSVVLHKNQPDNIEIKECHSFKIEKVLTYISMYIYNENKILWLYLKSQKNMLQK